MTITITDHSLAWFLTHARNNNASGIRLDTVDASDRGHLAQLQRAGLLTTSTVDGETWIEFTRDGVGVASTFGITI